MGEQQNKTIPTTQNPAKEPDLCFHLASLREGCTAVGRREMLIAGDSWGLW